MPIQFAEFVFCQSAIRQIVNLAKSQSAFFLRPAIYQDYFFWTGATNTNTSTNGNANTNTNTNGNGNNVNANNSTNGNNNNIATDRPINVDCASTERDIFVVFIAAVFSSIFLLIFVSKIWPEKNILSLTWDLNYKINRFT